MREHSERSTRNEQQPTSARGRRQGNDGNSAAAGANRPRATANRAEFAAELLGLALERVRRRRGGRAEAEREDEERGGELAEVHRGWA